MHFSLQTQSLRHALSCLSKHERNDEHGYLTLTHYNSIFFLLYHNNKCSLHWQLTHAPAHTPNFTISLPTQATYDLVHNTNAPTLIFRREPQHTQVTIDIGSIKVVKNTENTVFDYQMTTGSHHDAPCIQVNPEHLAQVLDVISLLNNPQFPVVHLNTEQDQLNLSSVEGVRCIRATIPSINPPVPITLSIPLESTTFLRNILVSQETHEPWYITKEHNQVLFYNKAQTRFFKTACPTMKITADTISTLYNSIILTNEIMIDNEQIKYIIESLSIINVIHDNFQKHIHLNYHDNPAQVIFSCVNPSGSVTAPIQIKPMAGLEKVELLFDHKVLASLLKHIKHYPNLNWKVGKRPNSNRWHLLRMYATNESCTIDVMIQAIQQ